MTETPENNNPTPEEELAGADALSEGAPAAEAPSEGAPAAESPSEGAPAVESAGADAFTEGASAAESAGADAPTSEGDEQSARADSPSDASTEEAEQAEAPAEPEPATEAPAAAEAPEQAAATAGSEGGAEEIEVAPRQKPEIPGADLEPDLMPDADQYLDAEALAAAEAEAEAAAERARAEAEAEQAKPIADAAIDLAAGARYTATGKRKTAVARVILKPGSGDYVINGKSLGAFFPRDTLQRMIRQPLETVGYEDRMDVVARMHGGGVAAQAGALRHGISRALIVADPNLRGELKRRGYLTRDPRVKERKKAGLKKARKRPQFSKR